MSVAGNLANAVGSVFGSFEEIKIGDLIVSALTGLDGSDPLEVTQKPVDQGFIMTDAAVALPQIRTLEICLADPEYSAEALVQAALTGSVEALTQTWREKKDLLYKMKDDRELISIQTHESVYESMIIQDISPHYDVTENWDAFFASVFVQKVRVVESAASGGLFDQVLDAIGGI